MKIASSDFIVVGKHADEHSLVMNRKRYLSRFTARDADHIIQQRYNPEHNIGIREVNSLLEKSIVAFLKPGASRGIAIGRHNEKIHELDFRLNDTLIEVITCFISSEIELIKLYREYEQS